MAPEIVRYERERGDRSVYLEVNSLGSFGFKLEATPDGYEFHFKSNGGVNHMMEALAPFVRPQNLSEKERSERLRTIANLFHNHRAGWLRDDLVVRFSSSELSGITILGVHDGDRINYGLRFANQEVIESAYFALLPESDLASNESFVRTRVLAAFLEKSGLLDEESLSELKTLVPQSPKSWGNSPIEIVESAGSGRVPIT